MCVCQDPRWYPLLSSKYTKQRPALLLSMVLESDSSKPSEPSPDRFKAKKAPPRKGTPPLCYLIGPAGFNQPCVFNVAAAPPPADAGSPSVSDLLPDKLEAVLLADQGHHQVGPADLCADMFVLSVTVAFATKLEQVSAAG